MSLIVDRLPFFEEATYVESPSGSILVRPYQIVLWISLSVASRISSSFPAILDTGHTHNFSIREQQLAEWAPAMMTNLRTIGLARVNKQPVVLKEAGIVIHQNVPGTRERLAANHVLDLPQGIAVHGRTDPFGPRLPLLGMRALVRNQVVSVKVRTLDFRVVLGTGSSPYRLAKPTPRPYNRRGRGAQLTPRPVCESRPGTRAGRAGECGARNGCDSPGRVRPAARPREAGRSVA